MRTFKRRWLWILLGAVLLGVTASSLVVLRNPLRKYTEQELCDSLLHTTPLGSNKDRVQEFIDSKGWENSPGTKYGGPFWRYLEDGGVGESAICVTLGSYQGLPWFVTVRAIWVFDEKGRLVDIEVSKVMDSF
jgi:hypothetical protein